MLFLIACAVTESDTGTAAPVVAEPFDYVIIDYVCGGDPAIVPLLPDEAPAFASHAKRLANGGNPVWVVGDAYVYPEDGQIDLAAGCAMDQTGGRYIVAYLAE